MLTGKHIRDCFSHRSSFMFAGFNMDTKGLIAIVCIIIAIIILLSLTIYTVVIEWRKISREHAQRQQSATTAAHSYENTECIKHEDTVCDKITSDRCQTTDSSDRVAMAGTHSGQSTGGKVQVHVETVDTSFWKFPRMLRHRIEKFEQVQKELNIKDDNFFG